MEARNKNLVNSMNKDKNRNIRFNRYMLFRYSLSFFFFINLFWLLISFMDQNMIGIVPSVSIVVIVLALAEQFQMLHKEEVHFKWTRTAFYLQLGIQISILAYLVVGKVTEILPLFSNTLAVKGFIAISQLLGMLIICLNLIRYDQIKQNKDRYYLQLEHFFQNS